MNTKPQFRPTEFVNRLPQSRAPSAPPVRSVAFLLVSLVLVSPSAAQFHGVQVNVDALGNNIVGDAANEPSVAVDPNDPNRIAIGWRQFDTISSNFRQAGIGYSTDGGLTWTTSVLDPGHFRSDPVLDFDADGNFYYSSYTFDNTVNDAADLFTSTDGGATWSGPVHAFGGDKQWIAIDRTGGIGRGNVYQNWNAQYPAVADTSFTRSVDGAASFESPLAGPTSYIKSGTMDVGPDGTLYVAGASLVGRGHLFSRSSNAQDPSQVPTFTPSQQVYLGGTAGGDVEGVNPAGLLGQVSIATDHSSTASRGNVYMLSSVNPMGPDPLDVMFIKSTDQGETWSEPVRVNNDSPDTDAYQWFGTMSVAPNGRIDAIWNDTRNDATDRTSELYYAYSYDAGDTWRGNIPLSEPFNQSLGYPNSDKLGDYYDMVSLDDAAYLAYAATFNGGQDVYFLRIDAAPPPILASVPEPSTLGLLVAMIAVSGCWCGRRRFLSNVWQPRSSAWLPMALGWTVAAIATTQPATSRAQSSQKFFVDTFDDANLQDRSPVSWDGFFGGALDASSGDLLFTPSQDLLGIATAGRYNYDDVSMRTQLRVSDGPFIDAGIFARFNRDNAAYLGTITSGDYLQAPSSLVISGYINGDYEIMAALPTTIRPSQTDVTLQFDLVGDVLTLTAWTDDAPKQSLTYQDNRLLRGAIGLEFDDGVKELFFGEGSKSATFRFFEATPIVPGDYNRNGQVEQADLDLVLLNWGDDDAAIPAGWELNFPEGAVDQQELDTVLLNWGGGSPLAVRTVPEPSAAMLFLATFATALVVRVSRVRGFTIGT